jgi:hypothetical protein
VRNPLPLLRDTASGMSYAIRAGRAAGDPEITREAVRLRPAAVAQRAGRSVAPSVFGRPIMASSAHGLAESFEEEVFLTGQYAVDLGHSPYIIDGGANIGLSVIYFRRRHPHSTVVAFEPSPIAFEHLCHNAGGLGRVRLEQAALGNHDGTLNSGPTVLTAFMPARTRAAPATTLRRSRCAASRRSSICPWTCSSLTSKARRATCWPSSSSRA